MSFEAMLAAKHAAERKQRRVFQAQYGKFTKCNACGANQFIPAYVGSPRETDQCHWCAARGTLYIHRYSPPPEDL